MLSCPQIEVTVRTGLDFPAPVKDPGDLDIRTLQEETEEEIKISSAKSSVGCVLVPF